MLPPPPHEKAKGEYELGTVIYDNKEVCGFGLREKEFLRHTGIFGITGTGKSNIVFKLIDELLIHKKNIFVFDWKRQYRDFLSIRPNADILIFGVGNPAIPCLEFNPLIPPPHIAPSQYLEFICQIVASSYYCGEGVIALLRHAITELYDEAGMNSGEAEIYPTFKDVLEYVQNIERKGRSRDWQESTVRSLQAICSGGLSEIVNVQKPTLKISELLSKNVFLELGELSESQKKFIIQSLMTYLYYFAMNRGEREQLLNVIVCEEAHHILRDTSKSTVKEPITDIILKEIREFCCGIIIIDQNPSLISVPALANNFCTIGLYTKHGSDISALSKAMFLDESQKECLGKLECGHGIVKLAGRIFEPFLVKFPLMNIKKGSITDSQVMAHMQKKGYRCKNSPDPFIIDTSFLKQWIIPDYSINPEFIPDVVNKTDNEHDKSDDFFCNTTDDKSLNRGRTDSLYDQPGIKYHDSDNQKFIPVDSIKDKMNKVAEWLKEVWPELANTSNKTECLPKRIIEATEHDDKVLKDIHSNPFDGIASRTKRLNISYKKCHKAISSLAFHGRIIKVEIKEKTCHRILFEINDSSVPNNVLMEGGIEHRFWNHQITEINRKAGYVVETEKKIDGNGYVDQVITKDNISTAIEIETGKSKPIDTILRDLKLGFQKVICVATSPDAFNMITRKLKQDNISVENISVVLAQNYEV